MKRALLGFLGVISFCFPVAAQQTSRLDRSEDEIVTFEQLSLYRPEILNPLDSSALLQRLPMLTLLEDRRLPVSTEMGRMGMAPLDLFPVGFLRAAPAQKIKASPGSGKDGKDSSAEVMTSPLNPVYYGGEVGVFYGHSSGKFGGDEFGTYIFGGVGTDKFQINAGASYQEWNGHVPRFRH